MDASLTVLDGNHASGVLTINATAIPNSAIHISGLTFQIDVSNNTIAGNQSTDTTQPERVMIDYFTPTGMNLDNNIFWDNAIGAGIVDIDVSGQFRHTTLRNNDIQALTGMPVSSTGALNMTPGFVGGDSSDWRRCRR